MSVRTLRKRSDQENIAVNRKNPFQIKWDRGLLNFSSLLMRPYARVILLMVSYFVLLIPIDSLVAEESKMFAFPQLMVYSMKRRRKIFLPSPFEKRY